MSTIIDEILEVKERSKVIFFVHHNIVSHPDQAKAFYQVLIPLKIRWVSQATITMTYDDEMSPTPQGERMRRRFDWPRELDPRR